MATNPIGKGTKTIGVNMHADMANELERRAESMGISTALYFKIILRRYIESGQKLSISEQ